MRNISNCPVTSGSCTEKHKPTFTLCKAGPNVTLQWASSGPEGHMFDINFIIDYNFML